MTDTEAAERTLAIIVAVHYIGDPYEKQDMGTDAEIEELMHWWEHEVTCLQARDEVRRIDRRPSPHVESSDEEPRPIPGATSSSRCQR